MLTYAVVKYSPLPEALEEVAERLRSYAGDVVSGGYLGSRGSDVYFTSGKVYMLGLLQNAIALEDALATSEYKTKHDAILRMCEHEPTTELGHVAGTADEGYCRHDKWDALYLMSDYLLGLSPLRCDECAGVVAIYRNKASLVEAGRLLEWHRQYDSLYALWLEGSEYETWAGTQLSDIGSAINKLGLDIAASLSAQLSIRVSYVMHTAEERDSCPRCGQALGSKERGAFRRCTLCGIMV